MTRYQLFPLCGLLMVVLGAIAVAQPDFRSMGKGGKSKKGGMDPNALFDMYANGKDSFSVSEVTVPERMSRFMSTEQMREQMTAFLQKKGVNNGVMTRALFSEYSEESRRQMMERFQQMRGGGTPGGTPGATTSPEEMEKRAKESFDRMDANKDGFLSPEEMQSNRRSNIYAEREKFDANKDGKIDLKEYTEYYKGRMSSGGPGGTDGRRGPDGLPLLPDGTPAVVEEKRPVVYRFGSLPKGLPDWYEKLDKDKDGQVGLYEWRTGGLETKEFVKYDANRDGFVTVEEVLRVEKAKADKAKERPSFAEAVVSGFALNGGNGGSQGVAGVGDDLRNRMRTGGDFMGKGGRGKGDFMGKSGKTGKGDFMGKGGRGKGDFMGKGGKGGKSGKGGKGRPGQE